jgi:AraC-like DNA-binding protein
VRRVIKCDARRLDDPEHGPFYAEMEFMTLGSIAFTSCIRSASKISHNMRQASAGDDAVSLLINLKGSLRISAGGRETLQRTPDVAMIRHDRPHTVVMTPSDDTGTQLNGKVHLCAYRLPRRALLEAAPNAANLDGGILNRNPAILDYLHQYTNDIVSRSNVPEDPALARTMSEHIFDLIAMLVGPTRDAAEVASRRGLRAARLKAILAYIEENLDNPDLGVKMIAAEHAISTRYVSQLMEEHGETLGHYILRRRLEMAAALLSDPDARHRRISDIAYACGFNDLSYFNRAFRRQLGESPSSFRP